MQGSSGPGQGGYLATAELRTLAIPGTSGAFNLDSRDVDCLIEPHVVVEVSTRETGIIEALSVNRGGIVKKGDPLLLLESGHEKLAVKLAKARATSYANVESKKAALEYLKRQQKRVVNLYKKKATSFTEKDKADTDVMLAEMELREAREGLQMAKIEQERAEHALARRTIPSPISGIVDKVLLDPGESVEDRPIMVLAQVDPLNVEVVLPLRLFGAVTVGKAAEIMPLVPGSRKHRTQVKIVDKVIDAASGTFGVRLELPNPDYEVPGGVRCEISFLE
ncbi:efflux RND transporter periplasmic adaptor subunit [Solemya velesiana gill symbiont]|uniref:efflux RND transporter periplasmic adaptor subunit n=1 Tax=Solemya velesiana gill symbiont TaxID=1918948 RepID=UPI00155FAD61|nr:efflux RND transporter periplasmic adaptor subunit [Solemya velesiana gill symbiont]